MYDIIIVGSGPAGMSAAVYAKRAGLSVVIIEKEYYGTGQVAESGQVDNYLGLDGMNGYDLGEKFRAHAEKFGTEFISGDVIKIEKTEEKTWKVILKKGSELEAKTIIYAAGATHRPLGAAGEDKFKGKGVSYCAICDGAFFKEKDVAVIGGGDTALDDALYLSDICSKVYLIHRRNEFRGSAGTVQKIKEKDNVELVLETGVEKIEGDSTVSQIKLHNGRTLSVNGVFVAVGMIPNTDIVKEIVTLDEQGYIVAGETGVTSEEGFYAAGDVRTKALRQVVTAVADGANAAVAAEGYIR